MAFDIPDWLTKDYIKKALEHGKNYEVTIQDVNIDMPIPKGTNYTSDIFRADIKYRISIDMNNLRTKSLIIKEPKKGPMFEQMSGMLLKESRMYNEFSPKLKSVFNVTEDDEYILAESYFATEEYILVLEDLKIKGYKLVDKIKRLDYNHCVVALKALAKFHAGSVIIHEKEPNLIKEIGKEMILTEGSRDYIVTAFKVFAEISKNYPQLARYSKWFDEKTESIFPLLVDSVKSFDNKFNVLNHGDFCTANMLFKYNENDEVANVKPVDLQLCRYASPVIDFLYFVETSAQEDVRKDKRDNLINVYLNELNATLKQYGSQKRLEKPEFEKSVKDRSNYLFYVLLMIIPFTVADPNTTKLMDVKETKMEDMTNTETNPMTSYYKNENFITIVLERLDELKGLGLIPSE